VINQAGLAQPLGYLLGLFVLGFKGVDQIQPNQVNHFDLDGHGATVGGAGVAHPRFVAGPTFGTVDVNNADGGFHSSNKGGWMGSLQDLPTYFQCAKF